MSSTQPAADSVLPATLAQDDDSVAEDLKLLTRMASIVTGAPNAFITFAEDAAPLNGREETYCSAALKGEDDVLVAEDVQQDARTRDIAAKHLGSRIVTYAGALIQTDDGRKLGTLCVTDEVKRSLNAEQIQLLRGLARQAMNLLALRQTKRELTQALEAMTRLATIDDLTGLLSRRAFFEEADRLNKLVTRQQGESCVVILDIDHFKRVNDHYGHAAGDAVLRAVARNLHVTLRSSDRVGRIGGEEFALILPFTHLADAMRIVEQLRERVQALGTPIGDKSIHVTLSGGVALLRGSGGSASEALKRADAALYRAKAAGRNQIMQAESTS